MSQLNLPAFQDASFETSAAMHDKTLTLHFKGSAELHVCDVLGPLLRQAHQEALRLGATEVQVDFEQLQFMTSSCLKRFVTWLNEVKASAQRPYTIRFVSNPRFRWQKASLAVLRNFAPESVTIQQTEPLPSGSMA
jgi:hypothetical protein